MNIVTVIYIYLGISAFSLFCTACYLTCENIKEVDSVWDWVIYNLFWIIQPIKSIIKLFRNL